MDSASARAASRAGYLLGVDSHELDKLPDLVEGLRLLSRRVPDRHGECTLPWHGSPMATFSGPELAYLVFSRPLLILFRWHPTSLTWFLPLLARDLSPTATFFGLHFADTVLVNFLDDGLLLIGELLHVDLVCF